MKKKILFLIHDLGPGGAEKVLVNLVNNLDRSLFDVTVMTLFDEGVNREFLSPDVKYKYFLKKSFPGNSHLMKLLSPEALHKIIVKDKYDIEAAYLEGPSARVIAGSRDPSVKKYAWIHSNMHTKKAAAAAFRSYKEAYKLYNSFDKIACVSEDVKKTFLSVMPLKKEPFVVYNTNETKLIKELSRDKADDVPQINDSGYIKLAGSGKLTEQKGFLRTLKILKRLLAEGRKVRYFILGEGPLRETLEKYIDENGLKDAAFLLGYRTNPYKYISKCDLFVLSSYAEGFSTAAAESLIVGTPVCAVNVSGMREMLGENNEYGIAVDNSDEELYKAIKNLLDENGRLEYYKQKALERGLFFSKEKTVKETENFLLGE